MYSGDAGLARNPSKVKEARDSSQSGTEPLPGTSKGFIIISRTQKSHFLRFLCFSKSHFFINYDFLSFFNS